MVNGQLGAFKGTHEGAPVFHLNLTSKPHAKDKPPALPTATPTPGHFTALTPLWRFGRNLSSHSLLALSPQNRLDRETVHLFAFLYNETVSGIGAVMWHSDDKTLGSITTKSLAGAHGM